MKTTQYVRQEKAIAAADSGGIRERWMFGLRLLRDPEVISSTGKSLRHGVADQLIAAAKSNHMTISAREIQRRIQCARTYPTEAQIRQVLADFGTWFELHSAGFPPYEAPEGEPLADHRTETERERDWARALLDLIGEQGALFPLDQFDPVTTTLKELDDYTGQMEALTARFRARDQRRRAYVDSLVAAAGDDMSMSWQEAHERMAIETSSPRCAPQPAEERALPVVGGGGS